MKTHNNVMYYTYNKSAQVPAFLVKINLTYIKDQLSSLDATSCGRIFLQRIGQTVEGFELLIFLLVFHLIGKKIHIVSKS